MARKPKTWAEKMNAPLAHVDITEKAFAGILSGTRLLTRVQVTARVVPANAPYGFRPPQQAVA